MLVQVTWSYTIPLIRKRSFSLERSERRLFEVPTARELAFSEIGTISRENDGVYWADLRVGMPPQVFSVIVDTGSGTIAVPCASCGSCGNQHKRYDITKSTSNPHLTSRRYSQCYSEGSCNSGNYIEDLMCIGENCDVASQGIRHPFGCCTTYAGAFKKQEADGIIGVSGSANTLISDLRKQHSLEKDLFSLCLSQTVGVIAVGGYDKTRHLEPIQWTGMTVSNFYTVKISSIHIEGQEAITGTWNPIVDSGTTFTYLPRDVHETLKTHFENQCGLGGCAGNKNPAAATYADKRDSIACYSPPDGMQADSKWLETFPTLTFTFGDGISICSPPLSYFFMSGTNAYCVGILKDSRFIIGAVTMSGFDVIFDNGQNRLGWARSICNRKDDTDTEMRFSKANCCGTCAISQSEGYNMVSKAPVTIAPTPAPVPETLTDDGLFLFQVNNSHFPGKTVLRMIDVENATNSDHSFSADNVLVVQRDVTLCDTNGLWIFAPGSKLFIDSHASNVVLGDKCEYSTVEVSQGSSVHMLGQVRVLDEFHIKGHVYVTNDLSFANGITSTSTTSLLEMDRGSNLRSEKSLFYEFGTIELLGGSNVFASLEMGPQSLLRLIPSGDELPIHLYAPLKIAGQLISVMDLNPFATFTILSDSSLEFVGDTSSMEIEISDDTDDTQVVMYLPEKARVFTLRKGIINLPTKFLLPEEFTCSGSTVDVSSQFQISFTSQDCFNNCLGETNHNCSMEQRERYKVSFINNSSSFIWNLQNDPEIQTAGFYGAITGVISSFLLYILVYPPVCFSKR